MKIYIGADHRGFDLKKELVRFLLNRKADFADLGASSLDPKDDYTVYAKKVADFVTKEKDSKGILLCGSGVGVDVAVNKFDGIRASVGINADQVTAGRRDDDMNVLVIAADFIKVDEAKQMLEKFLKTKFQKNTRHTRRLKDIKKIEESN